jgi:CDP-glycerol glycerophosphotransferase (TagB/SpsB family)
MKLTLYSLTRVLTKDSKLCVFGAWFGDKYSDNSKYLFEYVSKHHPEVRCVWLTHNHLAYQNVQQKGLPVFHTDSLRGIWTAMCAGVAIGCVNVSRDLPGYAFSSKTELVQLWHGIGPKAMMKERWAEKRRTEIEEMSFGSKIVNKIVLIYAWLLFGKWYNDIKDLPFNETPYVLATTTSQLGKQKLVNFIGVSPERVELTGYPRHDALLNSEVEDVPLRGLLQQKQKEGCTVCLYMPTHRTLSAESLRNFLIELSTGLKKIEDSGQKVFFLVKLHPLSTQELRQWKESTPSNLHFVTDEEILQDIYTVLNDTDILVTDYSSIYIDYLLLDKPIIFTPFDIENYHKNDQSFFMDYEEITPGPKAKNWEEVFEYVKKKDEVEKKYKKERQKVLEIFHQVRDGKSCERIFRSIKEKLKV